MSLQEAHEPFGEFGIYSLPRAAEEQNESSGWFLRGPGRMINDKVNLDARGS